MTEENMHIKTASAILIRMTCEKRALNILRELHD
jgi:hypothetical protein